MRGQLRHRARRQIVAPLVGALTAALGITATAAAPAIADAAPSLHPYPAVETARGPARTASLPDGGYLRVHAFGTVARQDRDGRTVWSRDSTSLYRDWQVSFQPGFVETPQLPWGSDPVDPLAFGGAGGVMVDDTHPYALGDLSGDGVADIAVADVVGVNTSAASSCPRCAWRFDVPGSDLHLGSFVTVLDGVTGRTLYSELDPGYVTQVAVTGGRLVIGDETGDPRSRNGIGQWGSASTVRAVRLVRAGGRLTVGQQWTYSTGAPWARLLDLVPVGPSSVAVAWSDTPQGLGVPGPPEGHVVLLDARNGTHRWDTRTAEYPVLLAADQVRGEVVAVQVADVFQRVGYSVSGLRLSDGHAGTAVRRAGALPLTLTVGTPVHRTRPDWLVGAVDATVHLGTFVNYTPLAGRVSAVDPDRAGERWSTVLPHAPTGVPQPGRIAATGRTVTVTSWIGPATPTGVAPRPEDDGLAALSGTDGALRWTRYGDTGSPLSMDALPGGRTVRTVTVGQRAVTYATADGRPAASDAAPGDLLTATTVDAGTAGGTELVAGDQSGAVYAFDGADLRAGTSAAPTVLWRASLPGAVHQLARARVDGHDVLVAAATTGVGVLDARGGRVRRVIPVPGGYVWTVTVTTVGTEPAVVVPTDTLTAYSLRSGRVLWRYRPPAGVSFSDAASADGVVAAEYSGARGRDGQPAAQMGAVGVDAATGRPVWTAPAADGTVRGQLWNGVVASGAIPGVGGHGVAMAWDIGGSGRIDVRDIRTGALAYADSDGSLDTHTGYVVDPDLGLLAVSQFGVVRVTPGGAVVTAVGGGLAAAVARTGSGAPQVLVADAGVDMYGADALDDPSAAPVASDDTYLAGTLITSDLGDGVDRVVALPPDWLAYRIVNGMSGYRVGPYLETMQHGLAVLTPGTDPAADTHRAPRAAADHTSPAPRPDLVPPTGPAAAATPVFAPEPVRTGRATPDAVVRPGSTASAAPAPTPYTPERIRSYLGLHGDGSGQTVAIVDAFDDPAIVADTEHFSEQFGLPGVCGAGGTAGDCVNLDVVTPDGVAVGDPDWTLETSMDLEWAHAVAPRANLLLVEAHDSGFAALFHAVDVARAAHPAALSMSWGIPFEFSDESFYDRSCATADTVCVASTGDVGHPGSYPAYDPAVLAVGGTNLALDQSGEVTAETAWSGSGGGRSPFEVAAPPQRDTTGDDHRQIPDVSFDADPQTGVAVYESVDIFGQSGWWQVGGTSLGAPVWASILADADQLRVEAGKAPLSAAGFDAQRAVYGLPPGVVADVTAGPPNGFCPTDCSAAPGYDEVTGLGSPRQGVDTALAAASGHDGHGNMR